MSVFKMFYLIIFLLIIAVNINAQGTCTAQAGVISITGTSYFDGSMGAPYTIGDVNGNTDPNLVTEYLFVDDSAGSVSGMPFSVMSGGAVSDIEDNLDFALNFNVCVTSIVYSQTDLDQAVAELAACF